MGYNYLNYYIFSQKLMLQELKNSIKLSKIKDNKYTFNF